MAADSGDEAQADEFGVRMDRIAAALFAILRREDVMIVLPMHPNPNVQSVLRGPLTGHPLAEIITPKENGDFVGLLSFAHIVLTGSGAIQGRTPRSWSGLIGTGVVGETFVLLDDYADLLHPSPWTRWLLVTSADHMPRAIGVPRSAFHISAYSVSARTHCWADTSRSENTASDNRRRVNITTHQWLLYYRLRAFSRDWFAGSRGCLRNPASAAKSPSFELWRQ